MTSFNIIDSSLLLHAQESTCNYFEFVLLRNEFDDVKTSCNDRDQTLETSKTSKTSKAFKTLQTFQTFQTFQTSIDKDTFYNLMYKMMDTPYKYNHKQYRELIVGDVQYHNHKNEEVSVFSVTTNAVENIENRFCMLVQQKNKHSILSLPSSKHIYNDNVVRKMIFRISNRVFVNFEHGMTDCNKYYKIYVNYNHDNGVDINNSIDTIKKVLMLLSH